MAKQIVDCELILHSLKLYGCLLLNLGYHNIACQMFYVLRDLGYEIQNWAFVMQAYDYLGRIYQADKDYEFALIAYKKLL